jgi:hypothetical protein
MVDRQLYGGEGGFSFYSREARRSAWCLGESIEVGKGFKVRERAGYIAVREQWCLRCGRSRGCC